MFKGQTSDTIKYKTEERFKHKEIFILKVLDEWRKSKFLKNHESLFLAYAVKWFSSNGKNQSKKISEIFKSFGYDIYNKRIIDKLDEQTKKKIKSIIENSKQINRVLSKNQAVCIDLGYHSNKDMEVCISKLGEILEFLLSNLNESQKIKGNHKLRQINMILEDRKLDLIKSLDDFMLRLRDVKLLNKLNDKKTVMNQKLKKLA